MLATSLTLAALSLGSLLASAAPVEPRIVETIECSPLDASYTADGLFWADGVIDATLVPVGIAADGNATWAPSASGLAGEAQGQWTFQVCNSTIIKQTSINNLWYGHVTFKPAGYDEALCLTVESPYNGETPHLQPCTISDDSGQYLQTWVYQVGLPARAGIKGTSFLRFVGPAGSARGYDGGFLGPNEYADGADLVMTSQNATDSGGFLTFSGDL